MCALSQERREAGLDDDDMSDTEAKPLSERVGNIDGGQFTDVHCHYSCHSSLRAKYAT